jgi:hypothetical protein
MIYIVFMAWEGELCMGSIENGTNEGWGKYTTGEGDFPFTGREFASICGRESCESCGFIGCFGGFVLYTTVRSQFECTVHSGE